MRSSYIVIEGLEGSGKTTTRNILVNTLRDLGVAKIVLVREPGGTFLAEKLRNLILDTKSIGNEVIHDKTETLLFYAARIQLVETVIKPAMAEGKWVISERNDLSTQAYQGGGRGVDRRILEALRNIVLEDFRPNLTLYLDVMPEIGIRRAFLHSEPDRIEQESIDFFKRTHARYSELTMKDSSIRIINANQPLKEMIHIVRKIVIQWVEEQKK